MRTSKLLAAIFLSPLVSFVMAGQSPSPVTLAAAPDTAANYNIIHSFTWPRYGYGPQSGVIPDPLGNLYGTTTGGGDLRCEAGYGSGCGTIFKLSPIGVKTVLYNFRGGPDGGFPYSNLIRDAEGNLYGTALRGDVSCNPPYGCGIVFKLDTTGKLMVLHSFDGQPGDGQDAGELIRDPAGNVLGTTHLGGVLNYGTVFTIDPAGTEAVLYSFSFTPDGAYAGAGLVKTPAGDVYGTASEGGALGGGTAFKLDRDGNETVLYNFGSTVDGSIPGTLIRDSYGNLYGTNEVGGAFGYGTVFKLDPSGTLTVLYSFRADGDGAGPRGLIRDERGNLYGTTYGGTAIGFCGTAFKLDPAGKFTVLHAFTGSPDGCSPYATLVSDATGSLYGTTYYGGTFNRGTVFKITP